MEEIFMTTRRHFLRAGTATVATGIVFCGCGLLHGARAQQPVRQKLPVMVNGKRVKTIDVHAHCHFREAGALLGEEGIKLQVGPINGASETFIDVDQRLAAMDSQAVDMEVLSINPFWYGRADREDPERKARRILWLKTRPFRCVRLAHPAGARSRRARA
jgi:aminocarboxymuconate-semialdehyde decarboxylase